METFDHSALATIKEVSVGRNRNIQIVINANVESDRSYGEYYWRWNNDKVCRAVRNHINHKILACLIKLNGPIIVLDYSTESHLIGFPSFQGIIR